MERDRFEHVARAGGDRATARSIAAAARAGDRTAAVDLAALWVHGAAVAPEGLTECYDGAAEGWFGRVITAPPIVPEAPAALPGAEARADGFWDAFWGLVLDERTGSDATDITLRTAALTGLMEPHFIQRVAATALTYPGVRDAFAAGDPVPFTLEQLARCPRESLGGSLHSLVVDKGFDLEVLDREALGLAALPVPLGYLNSRILQCHDIWHEVAGFDTTILHEIAISSFQLAQFGHHYSSMFLAVTASKVTLTQPLGVELILDTILAGWLHGRDTPPLLGVAWERMWHRPIADIRAQLDVTEFPSPYPADLLEQLMSSG